MHARVEDVRTDAAGKDGAIDAHVGKSRSRVVAELAGGDDDADESDYPEHAVQHQANHAEWVACAVDQVDLRAALTLARPVVLLVQVGRDRDAKAQGG